MHHLNPFMSLVLIVCGIALGFVFGVFWAIRHPGQARAAMANAHVGTAPTEPRAFDGTPLAPLDPNGQPLGPASTMVNQPAQTITKPPA